MSVQALSCAFAVRGLTPSEKLVLLALANFANEQMRCWPSQERLAADTELSARTVWAALKSLEARRVLSRSSRKRADGTRTTDVFTLHFAMEVWSEPVASVAKPTRKSCEVHSQPLQEPVAAVATLTTFEPSLEPSEEEPSSEAIASGAEAPRDLDPNGKAWADAVAVLTALGGMNERPARTFFGGLLAKSGLEPREMLGPIAEVWNIRTTDPQGYLTKAAMTRARRRAPAGPAKRVGFV